MCGQSLLIEALHFCNCSYLISKVRILFVCGKIYFVNLCKNILPFSNINFSFSHFSYLFLFWFTFFRHAVSWCYSQNYPPEVFYKTRFENFTEKHLCWSLFNKLYQKGTPIQVFFWEIGKWMLLYFFSWLTS